MGRSYRSDGSDRRWVEVEGAPTPERTKIPPAALRLLAGALDSGLCRWQTAGRAAGPGVDQVMAEAFLEELLEYGLVRVHERRNRRGDWEPYQWQITEAGRTFLLPPPSENPDVAGWLAVADPPDHPVLAAMREWLLLRGEQDAMATALVLAIGEDLRAGRTPRGRLLSVRVGGHTKAVRVQDHREALEAAFGGFALEEVVRLHGRAVLVYGDFRFRIGDTRVDGRWSRPWLALTQESIEHMEDLEVQAERVLTVENLVAFEEEVRAGLPKGSLAMFTSGFPGALERGFLERLCAAGIQRVDHWSDLDVGGLRIFRHLQSIVAVPVHPFRMDVATLDRMPTRPLTERDRIALTAWLQDPSAPLPELAQVLLERGVKAEQEGWFLEGGSSGQRG